MLNHDSTAWEYRHGEWVMIGGGKWITADLIAPWTNVGDPYHPVQYSRGAPRHLKFRGAAMGGTAGTVMFYITEDYLIPEREEHYVAVKDTSVIPFIVGIDGSVTPQA